MVEPTLTGGRVRGYAPNGANPEMESQSLLLSMTERARSEEKDKVEAETSNGGTPTCSKAKAIRRFPYEKKVKDILLTELELGRSWLVIVFLIIKCQGILSLFVNQSLLDTAVLAPQNPR